MRLLSFLFFILALVGCGPKAKPESTTHSVELREAVIEKTKLYLSLGKTVQDEAGFVMYEACDSLLFSGLYGAGGGVVDLRAARDESGMWHRRPLAYPECYGESSKSTISRDMMLGVLWYIWETQDLELAEELFAYGKTHEWIMGDGNLWRIYFTPGLQATLAELIYRLGGPDYYAYRAIPQSYSRNVDYAAHLDVLHILLRGELTGKLEKSAKDVLEYNFKRESKNALFSYAWHRYSDGNQDDTYALLLNEAWWPSDRLPTSADRCEGWLLQRDEGEDWAPCDDDKTHSGGDFLFVAKLLLRS
jgi:hypothetical protein